MEAKLSAMERTGKTKGGGDRERESRTGIKKNTLKYIFNIKNKLKNRVRFVGFFRPK